MSNPDETTNESDHGGGGAAENASTVTTTSTSTNTGGISHEVILTNMIKWLDLKDAMNVSLMICKEWKSNLTTTPSGIQGWQVVLQKWFGMTTTMAKNNYSSKSPPFLLSTSNNTATPPEQQFNWLYTWAKNMTNEHPCEPPEEKKKEAAATLKSFVPSLDLKKDIVVVIDFYHYIPSTTNQNKKRCLHVATFELGDIANLKSGKPIKPNKENTLLFRGINPMWKKEEEEGGHNNNLFKVHNPEEIQKYQQTYDNKLKLESLMKKMERGEPINEAETSQLMMDALNAPFPTPLVEPPNFALLDACRVRAIPEPDRTGELQYHPERNESEHLRFRCTLVRKDKTPWQTVCIHDEIIPYSNIGTKMPRPDYYDGGGGAGGHGEDDDGGEDGEEEEKVEEKQTYYYLPFMARGRGTQCPFARTNIGNLAARHLLDQQCLHLQLDACFELECRPSNSYKDEEDTTTTTTATEDKEEKQQPKYFNFNLRSSKLQLFSRGMRNYGQVFNCEINSLDAFKLYLEAFQWK